MRAGKWDKQQKINPEWLAELLRKLHARLSKAKKENEKLKKLLQQNGISLPRVVEHDES